MTVVKLSVSVPSELLSRAERILAEEGEGRSAWITRILLQAVRAAEEAEIDAAYDDAFARRPLRQHDLERTDALARAALRSTRRRGAPG